MKLKFKHQPYQAHAVAAVVDCFAGQPPSSGISFRVDPGQAEDGQHNLAMPGFRNGDIALSIGQILEDIQVVQRRQNLPQSQPVDEFSGDVRTV